MTVRNHSVDRLARWMATGVATAGLGIAIVPLAHGGPRRQPPRQAVVIAPAQQAAQPAAPPVYVPQPLYYPAGAPVQQVPQQYSALQQQMTGQPETAVARELRKLYEESGREAPQLPGMQPQPAPTPQYAPPPGYVPYAAAHPGYAVPPGYVAAPGYVPPPGFVPQPMYYPQPGYLPAAGATPPAAVQAPRSQPISTEPAEDPEFFPGDGLASDELDGFEFEETAGSPRTASSPPAAQQPLQPMAVMPIQPIAPPTGYGFAYPGPAVQQQPTPIITAGVVPPNVEPPPELVKLPSAEELIAGPPIEVDYEMAADPKIPKGFLGRFVSPPEIQKPPVEPNPYVPKPAAHLLAEDDDIPLAPSADVPGPEQDPAMAEIARFSIAEPPAESPTEALAVEEVPPPVVTPGVRTVPVAAAATIGSAARKSTAAELFKDESPAPATTSATPVETSTLKPAPAKSGGIAAGGLGPGRNVIPEQPEPLAPAGPVAAAPIDAPADPVIAQELSDAAAPVPTEQSASPYTGLSLDGAAADAPPLMARENQGLFFPPPTTPANDTFAPAEPLPLPLEPVPAAVASINVQPVSEAPPGPTPERSPYTQSKYEQIASRKGATGLKGFCPVRLRDHRDLADGQAEFRVQHGGRVYALSSAEALQTFLADPEKYTPAANGYDVVLHRQSGETVEGVLDHSAWFKGRLYLFNSAENKDAFVASPASFAVK